MTNYALPQITKNPNTLRIAHTADWHIGKRLINQSRYDEFEAFLDWLCECLTVNAVDILVVAGDIFDTMTPSNKAQEIYYNFLAKLNNTPCRHAVIVAGNHDSPSFLDAPKSLFRHFNIHIVGTISDNIGDEVLVLDDKNGEPVAIICATPYLRDRDVRQQNTLGETLSDKENATAQGIANHYKALSEHCKSIKNQELNNIPIIATGHLFATGASVSSDDDGMRELYVGTLGQIGAEIFDGFDYVALGHIHREQMVGKQPHIRYSGSPIAMGFGESGQSKKILLVDFENTTTPIITPIEIPIFRKLINIIGDWKFIENQLLVLKGNKTPIWLNIEHTGTPIIFDIENKVQELLNDNTQALSIKQKIKRSTSQNSLKKTHSLSELTPKQVFDNFLNNLNEDTNKKEKIILNEDDKVKLLETYESIIYNIHNDDSRAM